MSLLGEGVVVGLFVLLIVRLGLGVPYTQVTSYKLRVTSYELGAKSFRGGYTRTSYKSSLKSQLTTYNLQATSYKVQLPPRHRLVRFTSQVPART